MMGLVLWIVSVQIKESGSAEVLLLGQAWTLLVARLMQVQLF